MDYKMEDQELFSNEDLQMLNPVPDVTTPLNSAYENYKEWAGLRAQNLGDAGNLNPSIPPIGGTGNNGIGSNMSDGKVNSIAEGIARANGTAEDSTRFAIRGEEVSKRYPVTFKGVDNESIYASGQTLGEKAFNGVTKMVGTASTTFINGTVGTVYGIASALSAENGHRIEAFYNNDLSNYLNNINVEMEDKFAHYKTERERNGNWWEPNNLFTANFLFDNIIKNLGFSIGALGAGFTWGGALKVLGLTGRLIGTGRSMATAADSAIAEASLLPEAQRLATMTNRITQLYNSSRAGLGNVLMSADRGIVATFGTFGEAGIEALGNAQLFKEEMVRKYTEEHGYAPDEIEMQKINDEATSVGNWSFGLNSALLTATNYIQLPKIFASSFRSERSIANNIALREGAYVSTLPQKGIGKLLYQAKNIGSLAFNTAEAFEEGAQYAIQTGTQNYFDRKYRGDKSSALTDGLLYGVKEALTTNEGTLNIFIGGFSGALQSSGIHTLGRTGKIAERGITGFGGEQGRVRNEAIAALNNTMIKDKMKKVFENINVAETIQQDREAAIRRGDILESKDLEFDYAHNFISSRLQYGAKEAIDTEINLLRDQAATNDGFIELQKGGVTAPTDTRETFLARLDNLQQHADHAEKMYDAAKLRYGGLVDEKGERIYTDEVIDKMVYAGSKIMDYDRRIPQLENTLINTGVDIQSVLQDILIDGKKTEDVLAAANEKIEETEPTNADELKQNLEDLVEASARRKLFIEEYRHLKNNPVEHQVVSAPETSIPTEEKQPKQTVKIKTKLGERDIVIGDQYMLGRDVKKSDKGFDVFSAPLITILSKEEDGTFTVQSSTGRVVKGVTPEQLEQYSLSKPENLDKNLKAKFVVNTWNKVWEHKGIKINGVPAKGRLEYDKENHRVLFVYKDAKGRIQRREVLNTMFSQSYAESLGYKAPMLTVVGELTASERKIMEDYVAEKTTVSDKIKVRNQIVSELYENSKARIEEIVEEINSAKTKFNNDQKLLQDQIAEESLTKKGAPRKRQTKLYKQLIKDLTDLRDTLKTDLDILNSEKEELESTIPFLKAFLDDIESTPDEGAEMIKELKEDIGNLENLIEATDKSIKKTQRVLDKVNELLKNTLEAFNSFLGKLKSMNPNLPLFIDELQARVERYLGPEGAEQYIQDKVGFTEQVLELENDIADYREEINLPTIERKAFALNAKLTTLQEELDELIATKKAKEKILASFEEFAERVKQAKEEEKRMQTNPTLVNELIGTLNKNISNFFGNKLYRPEAKKDSLSVVSSTRPVNDEIPYQQRVNYLGQRIENLRKRENIKGVVITQKTQDEYLPGLVEHLLSNVPEEDKHLYPANQVIAMVLVEEDNRGRKYLIDQEGSRISEDDADKLNKAIYQVFPAKNLMGHYRDTETEKVVYSSMFREETPDEVKEALSKQYSDWVDDQLSRTETDEPVNISVSFGHPDFVRVKGQDGKDYVDHNARTTAEEAGLVDTTMLLTQPVVSVKTSDTPFVSGEVTFKSPKGRVFLTLPNGAARLQNRKFNEEEVKTIYDVILQVSKDIMKEGKATPETNKLFEWLRSTVYWGIAKTQDGKRKPAGYNNIWFEKVADKDGNVTAKLFISGKSGETAQGIDFVPSEIINRKGDILMLISELYSNTSNHLTNESNWNKPYIQITGVNPDGSTNKIEWPNYQSYLLSDKLPDNNKKLTIPRKKEDIPLTTKFRPLVDENDTNRKGVYFVMRDASSMFDIPEIRVEEKVVEPAPSPEEVKKEEKPIVTQTVTEPSTTVEFEGKPYKMDGVTPLEFKVKSGVVSFTFDAKKLRETNDPAASFGTPNVSPELMEDLSKMGDKAGEWLGLAMKHLVSGPFEKYMAQFDEKVGDTPKQEPSKTVKQKFDLTGGTQNTLLLNKFNEPVKFTINYSKFSTGDNSAFTLEYESPLVDKVKTAGIKSATGQVVSTDAEVQGYLQAVVLAHVNKQLAEEKVEENSADPIATPRPKSVTITPSVSPKENEETIIIEDIDELFYEAARVVVREKIGGSASLIQRHLKVGYNRAGIIISQLEEAGIVGEFKGDKARELFFNDLNSLESHLKKIVSKEISKNKEAAKEVEQIREETGTVTAIDKADVADANDITQDEIPTTRRRKFGDSKGTRGTHDYRIHVLETANQYEGENWAKVEKWLAEKFPGLPVYRVKNMIRATNGRYAHGALYDAAIYLSENAEVGTVYHEVFEAVWKMFAGPKEKNNIIKEFRNREGSYVDRESQKTIKYSEATDSQIKEQLAEEFRDKMMLGKDPVISRSGNFIVRLFKDLIAYIKTFFTGKDAVNNTRELFNKIGEGYYKTYNPYLTKLSFAQRGIIDIEDIDLGDEAELRLDNIPAMQLNDTIQLMTYEALKPLMESNEILFSLKNVIGKSSQKFYAEMQDVVLDRIQGQADILVEQQEKNGFLTPGEQFMYDSLGRLFDAVQDEWPGIVEKHGEYLRTFSLEFDENDELNTNEGEESGKSDWQDARTIDSFRKASAGVKLLLGTLPIKKMVNGKVADVFSSIGGPVLLPADQVHIDLMNRLHDSVDVDEMLFRLRNIASKEANYRLLYKRLTGKDATDKKANPYEGLTESDYRLISSFWRNMKKQNADVITVFVQPSGEVIISDTTLASATKSAKREMMGAIIDSMKEETTPYFSYNKSDGTYKATAALKKVEFDKDIKSYTDFLKNLGISIDPAKVKSTLNDNQLKTFRESVSWIKDSMSKVGDIVEYTKDDGTVGKQSTAIKEINTRTLDIDSRMTRLSTIKAILDNPQFESTYFNINGQRTQSYVGPNAISSIFDVISKLKHLEEDLHEPQNRGLRYLMTDTFSNNSMMLKKMFEKTEDGYGKRKSNTEDYLKPVFIDGTVDDYSGKKKESSKLNYKQRFLQEINLNLDGVYLNLVPGDASIEHAVRMHYDNDPFVSKETYANKSHHDIFRDYFIDEVNMAREERLIASVPGRKNTDLRFLKSILQDTSSKTPDALHDKIMYGKGNEELSAEQLYEDNKKEINAALDKFIEDQAKQTKALIDKFGIIVTTREGVIAPGLNFTEEELQGAFLKEKLEVLSVNYMIANIEMHKLFYSDPYQYSDELKRIKNFNSPRQSLVWGSQGIGTFLQEAYNKGIDKNDVAFTDFERDYFRTATIDDILSTNENKDYDDPYEETDGGGYMTIQGARKFKLRLGEWTPNNEKQFQFDMEFFRKLKANESEEELAKYLKGNPGIKNTYTPNKPIVSGNKENGRNYNDSLLHKFALATLSPRILYELDPNSDMMKLYEKMVKEDIDYVVYNTGSKVGTETVHPLLNADGTFNNTPFESEREKQNLLSYKEKRGITNVPFSIIGLQTEVPSKDVAQVTQGSQITKLVTLDFLEAGVPVDYELKKDGVVVEDFLERFVAWTTLPEEERKKSSELYKLIQKNRELLEQKIEDGFDTLLKKLGITLNSDGSFTITKRDKFIDTLRSEILKREVNDNITDAFNGFEDGHVVLEATPAYQQIRNILYSIADKKVVRTKLSGGMKVQVPSTALLSEDRVVVQEKKQKDGTTKPVFSSEALKFYKNAKGERVAEIMVGRWFDSDMTDDQLIHYFNETEEGKKQLAALTGVAFRIPTQKQNSIDAIKIKKFLPKDYGDAVVIPSALVKKVGSDFDIDKLSIYLKNLTEINGKLSLVPFYGFGQQAKDKFAELFDKELERDKEIFTRRINSKENLRSTFFDIAMGTASESVTKRWAPKLKSIFSDYVDENGEISVQEVGDAVMTIIERLNKRLDQLNDSDLQEIAKELFIDSMYKKSLENEYIQSLEDLITHERNYDALVKPNSADYLKSLSSDINKLKGREKTDYTNVGNMLKRQFMSGQRHDFVTGKQAIGIAAVAQTNHSQNQRGPIFLDFRKLYEKGVNHLDKAILGGYEDAVLYANNPRINFTNFNTIKHKGMEFPTLSLSKAKGTQDEVISDTIGMFIDGYVDISKGAWIMELGATPNVAGTWLYLVKLGVPIDDVAYFMNQPIIQDYLQKIENKGQTWLFSERNIDEVLSLYGLEKFGEELDSSMKIPNVTTLAKTIGKDVKDMSVSEKEYQRFMLKEFVKYAKQASQLFEVTQGSNHDTANINDPYLVFKKRRQTEKARKTILTGLDENQNEIPAVDALMKNSFVGVLKNFIDKYRDAFSEVLLSDKPRIREIMESVLDPYISLSDRDFIKVSQKAVNDLFDWAVQTDRKMNTEITRVLLGDDKESSAAKQIMDFRDSILGNPAKGIPAKDNHPLYFNIVLQSLQMESGANPKKVNNISLGSLNKVYNQNLIISGFNELREYLNGEKSTLYGKIVRLAVLQSGLTNSKIAFTSLLPYKDFKEVYNATLSTLEKLEHLNSFKILNVFERNNWSNRDLIPTVRPNLRQSQDGISYYDLNKSFLGKKISDGVKTKYLPMIVNINESSSDGRSDFIVYTWDTYLSPAKKALARKTGDRSHVNKVLMKKVYTTDEEGNRTPLLNISEDKKSGKIYRKFVYKAINAWGDSFKAQEFYIDNIPSKLDNEFKKIMLETDVTGKRINAPEVEDSVIADLQLNRISLEEYISAVNKTDGTESGAVDINDDVEPLAEAPDSNLLSEESKINLGVSQEEWNSLSPEEQKKIIDQNKSC